MDSFSPDYDAGHKRELALEAVGKFRSGTEGVSERHDEYLVQAFQG